MTLEVWSSHLLGAGNFNHILDGYLLGSLSVGESQVLLYKTDKSSCFRPLVTVCADVLGWEPLKQLLGIQGTRVQLLSSLSCPLLASPGGV